MTLTQILIFVAGTTLFGLLAAAAGRLTTPERPYRQYALRARGWVMLVASIVAVFWLQSSTPIRNLDFWLPVGTLGLTGVIWAATRRTQNTEHRAQSGEHRTQKAERATQGAKYEIRDTVVTLAVIGLTVLAIALTRYVDRLCCLTPTTPPQLPGVLAALAGAAALVWAVGRYASGRRWLVAGLVLLILGLFVVLKTEPLAQAASTLLRSLSGQAASQASALDLRWLGFSYIAFRWIHVLRDRANGRLPALSLHEFVTYVVFFPSLTAGPIDRAERFAKDFRVPQADPGGDVVEGGRRVLIGIFKKFAVADTLAIVALNGVNAEQTTSTLWTWVLLYAFAFRLYFDFSGYTDIAVGMGRMLGVRLPENFDRPYVKPNLTAFWNSWHMTLSNWFRAYWFNPFTRALRSRASSTNRVSAAIASSPALIIFIGQTTTMALIGLWHGVTWNFLLWGLWQALGLFIHNRWVDTTRRRAAVGDRRQEIEDRRMGNIVRRRVAEVVGVAMTFNYVALGWVWFALPSVELSLRVFGKLFGG